MSLILLPYADHEITKYDPKLDYLTKTGIAYSTAVTQSQSPAVVKSNMFLKGYPLEAKTAPKN